jgi:hypothetical protein
MIFSEAELKAGRGGVHKQVDFDSMDTLKRLGIDPASKFSDSKLGMFLSNAFRSISVVTVLKGSAQVVRRYPVVSAVSALMLGCAIGRKLYQQKTLAQKAE